MTVLMLVQSMFTFRIFVREMDDIIKKKLVQQKMMTKIGTTYVVLQIFGIIIAKEAWLISQILLCAPVFLLFAFEKCLLRLRIQQFSKHLIPFLSRMILQMHAGSSYRESFKISFKRTKNQFVKEKLSEIYDHVVFSQHNINLNLPELDSAIAELVKIDRQNHRCIQRTTALRDKLQTSADFRRRSGQILHQVRAQAIVLLVLYIAVLMFVIHEFGFKAQQNVILSSMGLFLVGIYLSFTMGGRIKWKL